MDTSVLLALIAIASTFVTAILTAWTWTQRTLIATLVKQIADGVVRESERVSSCESRNDRLVIDNRTNAETTIKLVGAIEKLADEQARGTQLLGDLVYGRTSR